jgi:hypothetical protein
VLEAVGADGTTMRTEHVFAGVDEQVLQLPAPPRCMNPLTLALSVTPLAPLKGDKRAVIDISVVEADVVP